MYSLSRLNKLLGRNKGTHKGENGKLLVIAGSYDLAGAAILASVAAMRVGADIVTLACPEIVGVALNSYCPDIMTIKLKGKYLAPNHIDTIFETIAKYDTLLIGNGIGQKKETQEFISQLLKNPFVKKIPKVIDAEAIRMLKIQDLDDAILTPHKREYEALLKNSNINSISEIRNNIIILKGKVDQIITKERTYLNHSGNAGMAKAGTGDVLAGICAGILAKTKDPLKSALAAAWLNGYLGDILEKKKKGYYFIASDLLKEMEKLL